MARKNTRNNLTGIRTLLWQRRWTTTKTATIIILRRDKKIFGQQQKGEIISLGFELACSWIWRRKPTNNSSSQQQYCTLYEDDKHVSEKERQNNIAGIWTQPINDPLWRVSYQVRVPFCRRYKYAATYLTSALAALFSAFKRVLIIYSCSL